MFDINTQAVASTGTLHVKGLDGQPLYNDGKPVQIVLHSPGTHAFAKVESLQTARSLKRASENDNKLTAATAEERLAETADDLAAVTVEFVNFAYDAKLKGEEQFRALYADPKLGHITRQVTRFLGDWSNFKAA